MRKYHLIGIKGTGMSALAVSLKKLGYDIRGSDVEEDFFTTNNLLNENIEILPFDINNITDEYTYIITSAFNIDNIEVKKVMENKYQYYYYHDFISYFYRGKIIGISGTHGKTTTSLMLTNLMQDYPIAAVIGDGTGIGQDDYQYFIFESCEYQNHFLKFDYDYLIINNIDFDHPDFFSNIKDVKSSFQEAANKTQTLIINGDEIECKDISHNNKYTFGLLDNNFLKGKIIDVNETGYLIRVNVENKMYQYKLPYLGIHMVYNFLGALTAYYLIGADLDKVNRYIESYVQPKRRMEEYKFGDNIVVDDYAHHPKEIIACINAIKLKYPNRKLIVLFEPHTYSRTLALENEFKNAFQNIDELYLADTFTSKRESYSENKEKLIRKIFLNPKRFTKKTILKLKKYNNSIIVFMGAGNIRKYINELIE